VCYLKGTTEKRGKNWLGSSNLPGEHLNINISSIKERSIGGAKFWALIVDYLTDFFECCVKEQVGSQSKDKDFIN
jgi:hypothetical protein